MYEARGRLTDRFDRALVYAAQVHGGQMRKGTRVPYLAHLLAVSATVLEYGGDEDMAIAGLLHDAAEDHGGERRLEDIANRFGDTVAGLVRTCSDSLVDTHAGAAKEDWLLRKQRYLGHLGECHPDALLVSLADKVHNARSILRDLRKSDVGRAVWRRFNRGVEDQLWYYQALGARFRQLLPGQLAEELVEIASALAAEQ